jgi:MFS family permease
VFQIGMLFRNKAFLRVLVMLFLVEFVRGAFLMSFLPAYGVNHLGFSVAMVGTAVTAHYAADTVVKIAMGYVLNRFSMRWIVSGGLLLAVVSLLSLQVMQNGVWLVISSILYGIGLSPVWLACVSYIEDQHRGTQMGSIYTAWLGGIGGGLFLTNFLLDRIGMLVFWLLIVLAVLGFLASLSLPKSGAQTLHIAGMGEQVRELVGRLRLILPLLPGMILQTLAASMMVPVLPSFVTNVIGLHYSQYSLVLLLGGVCAVAGLIPMGRLSDHFGERWFLVGGFGIFAITLAVLSGSRTFGSICVLAVVLGLSYSAVLPAWNALLASQVSEEQKTMSWGIFSSLEGIGVMFGPILGGWIAELVSARATLLVSAVVMGLIALFYAVYPIQAMLRKKVMM